MPEPPVKKRKLDVPDGFATKEKEKSKIRVPQFESGFGVSAKKPLSKMKAVPMPIPSGFKESTSTSASSSKTSSKSASVTTTNKISMKPISKEPLVEASRAKPSSKGPPQFLPLHEPEALPSTPVSKPASKGPPQFQLTHQTPRNKPISTSSKHIPTRTVLAPHRDDVASVHASPKLKALAPPILPPTTPLDTSDYKPLAPILPIQNQKPKSKSTPMKTIATTRVALATDISSDGAAELASILLQDHDLESEGDWEKRRGVHVSPSKGDRIVYASGGNVKEKWMKGGLAAHASSVLTKVNTSYALWNKEAGLRSSGLKPDMKIRLVKVLYTLSSSNAQNQHHPSRTLAICQLSIRHKTKIAPFPLESPSQRERRMNEEEEVKHLIALLSTSAVEEDQEVWLWKPWTVVPLTTTSLDAFDFSNVFSVDESRLRVKVHDNEEVELENEIWLCERVRLVQGVK
ncbi:hypothetical protein VNI00_004363 [Paramarasmius palmivorus]|uniref:Uncharacterized protein n=1 Tax=Paramarasmius palmivorus TaxID=297713 RepID=A0AAW0DML5_9AGAR